jgi:hypothetical protein
MGILESADKLLERAKANGYQRGAHREQDAVPNRHAHVDKTKYDQDGALRRYVVYEGPSSLVYKWAPVLTQSSRWNLGEMREDAIRRGVTPPDERTTWERCLRKGVEAPSLAVVKDFLRFQASLMRGKIKLKPTDDSLNCFAEWFFAGFTRLTQTVIPKAERSEVYNVS